MSLSELWSITGYRVSRQRNRRCVHANLFESRTLYIDTLSTYWEKQTKISARKKLYSKGGGNRRK